MKSIITTLTANFVFLVCFSQNNIYTLIGHNGAINTLAFSKDGKYLLSGSRDSSVIFWDIKNNFGFAKKAIVAKASITYINFSPSGRELAVCSYQNVSVYAYPEFKKLYKKKKAHSSFVECANFSKNGDKIITSSWRDNSLILWKTKKLKKEKVFPETEWTDNAIFVADDEYIASVNHSNTIKIWDVKGGNLVRTFAGHTDWVYDLFVTKDRKHLVSGSLDKTIKVWDFNTGKLIQSIQAHNDGITALCLSEDGKFFASASIDKTVKIWRVVDFTEVAHLKGHEDSVLSVKISSDGKYLASSSSDKNS